MSEFEVDLADDKPRRLKEVKIEPVLQKALRLRNTAKVGYLSAKKKRKAEQIIIRSAKAATSGESEGDIQASVMAAYIDWLAYQPSISLAGDSDGVEKADYLAFLAEVGRVIERWHHEENDVAMIILLC